MVVGDNVKIDAGAEKSKFAFSLTQYKDGNLTEPIAEDHVTPLGSRLYFQLATENPVSSLTYSYLFPNEMYLRNI